MEPLTVALLVIAAASFLLYLISQKDPYRGKRLPPGPKGLPLFGSALSIPARDYLKYEEYAREYGDVVLFRVGTSRMLLLNSLQAMRDALITQADVFSTRMRTDYFDNFVGFGAGIVFSDGEQWQQHRRLNLRIMRDFGAGKSLSEEATLAEEDALREKLVPGKPIDMMVVLTDSVNNVISQISFGERIGTEDKEFEEFEKMLRSINQDRSMINFIPIIFPFTMKIPLFMRIFEYFVGFKKVFEFSHNFIYKKMRQHEELLAESGRIEDQEPRDVCDALLIERAKRDKDPSSPTHTFNKFNIMRDLEDLFLAGTDTTSMTLTWSLFLMSRYQDVQSRVQEQIDAVIGRERKPTMMNRRQMPYVSAVIDEILRYATIAPTGVPHRCCRDTELMGNFIPKDTTVITNIYAIHRDPNVWEKPNEFYPEHFLTPDGEFKPSEHSLSFSMGRRVCAGEGLARIEIFLFFTSIFQHLSVRLADPKLDAEKVMLGMGGGTRRLLPHEVIFTAR